ncbi:MAG: hypothetical protein Q9178_000233 [Gyalolechia marmorata]
MTTITETREHSLQLRPEPQRLRSGNKRHGIVTAPPSPLWSGATTLESLAQDVEKFEEQLPPVDGGIAAWRFLFAAFVVEAFIFGIMNPQYLRNFEADGVGFPLNYGVFQNYYFTHPTFEGNANLSTIGTLGTAFYFLGAPVATYLVRRYHRWQREVIWSGCTVSIVGLVAASFAPDFRTLVATQGVIYGVGVLIIFYPVFSMLNEWFVDRRGLALGILCAATGVSGLFYPFVLEILLNSFAQMLGQIAFGKFSDLRIKRFWMEKRIPVEILIFISPLMSGIAILGLWGTATSITMLVVFASVYGFFAGGFVVLWARMGTTLSPSPSVALITFSAFACQKGVGNIVTGPISSILLTSDVNTEEYGIGRFKDIILYSGDL